MRSGARSPTAVLLAPLIAFYMGVPNNVGAERNSGLHSPPRNAGGSGPRRGWAREALFERSNPLPKSLAESGAVFTAHQSALSAHRLTNAGSARCGLPRLGAASDAACTAYAHRPTSRW